MTKTKRKAKPMRKAARKRVRKVPRRAAAKRAAAPIVQPAPAPLELLAADIAVLGKRIDALTADRAAPRADAGPSSQLSGESLRAVAANHCGRVAEAILRLEMILAKLGDERPNDPNKPGTASNAAPPLSVSLNNEEILLNRLHNVIAEIDEKV